VSETPRNRMATDEELVTVIGVSSTTGLPRCTTKEDLERHQGSRVEVVGVLHYKEPGPVPRRGKIFLGPMLLLEDNTPVVLSYHPPASPIRQLKGRRVAVTGIVLPGAPNPMIQALLAHHMVGINSIRLL